MELTFRSLGYTGTPKAEKKQTAYQIIAKSGGKIIWNSGKVFSSRMTHIRYEGEPLRSRQRVYWSVKLWDENGEGGEISTSFFEMGLLESHCWKAKWITGDYKVNSKERYPVDCFRKVFEVRNIRSARLYATACGIYEGMLNGQRIGGFVLAPGHTDYRKRIQYQAYDVTELIRSGENEITFQVADGWYRGSCGAWGLKNQYGTETKLLVQLELTDTSGIITTVCTDGSWQWSNDGPIRFADNKDGEVFNANSQPSYNGKAKETTCAVVPTASNNVFITEHEHLKPKRVTTPSGKSILDFGQNIAGYLAFSLSAKQGQRMTLRFGEMLDSEGEFTQANIQCVNKKITTPLQQVIYTCKEGVNHYKTRFAIFGFRYVLVESDTEIHPEDFTAIAVYSDLETTAEFDSSNELLKSNIWTHIISLRREDAQRLGYDSAEDWMNLLRSKRNVIAQQMGIKPENFRWYAAFHDAGHHPHVHMMAYSIDPKEAYLTEKGIETIKAELAKEIFRQDQISIYQKQTQYRDQLRSQGRESIAEIVKQINSGGLHNERIEALLIQLSDKLSRTSGKKVYGYLKPETKAIVNEIVAELSRDSRIKKLYDLWYEQREDVLRTYTDHFPERIPLEQNPEFKSIRNAVIQEAMNLLDTKRYYEDTYGIRVDLGEKPSKKKAPPAKPPGEQNKQTEQDFQRADQQVIPHIPKMEAPSPSTFSQKIHMEGSLTANATLHLLQNLSKLIEQKYQQEQREEYPSMDRKQRQEIAEKQQALGLRG